MVQNTVVGSGKPGSQQLLDACLHSVCHLLCQGLQLALQLARLCMSLHSGPCRLYASAQTAGTVLCCLAGVRSGSPQMYGRWTHLRQLLPLTFHAVSAAQVAMEAPASLRQADHGAQGPVEDAMPRCPSTSTTGNPPPSLTGSRGRVRPCHLGRPHSSRRSMPCDKIRELDQAAFLKQGLQHGKPWAPHAFKFHELPLQV